MISFVTQAQLEQFSSIFEEVKVASKKLADAEMAMCVFFDVAEDASVPRSYSQLMELTPQAFIERLGIEILSE